MVATRRAPQTTLPLGDVDPFSPSADHPVRTRARTIAPDTHIEPHQHAWAQLAYCASGLLRVSTWVDQARETTYTVPPSRALWIPPLARHAVTVVEASELRTLYIDASVVPAGWNRCHVLVVSSWLRALIHALDEPHNSQSPVRQQALNTLLLDDLVRADTLALGVPLPCDQTGDRRLRALCKAVLQSPDARSTLAEWSAQVGASERTMARLFKEQLGTSYQQWRQQAVLAHALPMLIQGLPVSRVADACGYATDSAFSAMFKAAMGHPPSHFATHAHHPR